MRNLLALAALALLASSCAGFGAENKPRPPCDEIEDNGVVCVYHDPEGDSGFPPLDVTLVRASHAAVPGAEHEPWLDIQTAGGWPPAPFYSWYLEATYLYAGTTVTVTIQRHDGVESVIVNGVPSAAVAITDRTTGPVIQVDMTSVEWEPKDSTRFSIQTGYLEFSTDTEIDRDEVPDNAADVTLHKFHPGQIAP